MKKTKYLVALVVLAVAGTAARAVFDFKPKNELEGLRPVKALKGQFRQTVSATASVQPDNHVVVTPTVEGRIDRLMVEDGELVKAGQILAWMSSADRAALLDAARAQGGKDVKEWLRAYKPTPILAPVAGRVIARHAVPGQTVTHETQLFELSDRLVIRAQVDETDIAKVKKDQNAFVRIDAFSGKTFPVKVAKIGHQSTLVNSISTYEVLLTGAELPAEMRSGMTASVDFVLSQDDEAVLVPAFVAGGVQNQEIEILVAGPGGAPEKRKVRIGGSNGERVQVVAGLRADETVYYRPVDLTQKSGGPLGFLNGNKKTQ